MNGLRSSQEPGRRRSGRTARRVFFNDLGQTTTDIARSRRFYDDLLGFEFWWDFESPDEIASKVHHQNRGAESAPGLAIYLRDPDGQLIEIVTMALREKLALIPGRAGSGPGREKT